MRQTVWLLAPTTKYKNLEQLFCNRDLEVRRVGQHFTDVALSLYDARGLLVVDAEDDECRKAIMAGAAIMPLLAICDDRTTLPPGTLRVDSTEGDERIVHHVLDILNHPSNQRRYPRVRVDLKVKAGAQVRLAKNISFYGIWVEPAVDCHLGERLQMAIFLSDGAQISLDGWVVAKRPDGTAMRVRPCDDEDLLLWVHLLLGELSKSPLHGDVDPFGELFR